MTDPIAKLINAAKTDFILEDPKNPFLTSLMCSVPLQIDESIPTACVSPFWMKVNEGFFRMLNPKQRKTLIAHEILHLAMKHVDPARQGDRDDKKWNIAGDHVINNMLKEQGFEPIEGWYCDEQYRGMSTEEVYDALPEDCDKGDGGIGNDIASMGDQDGDNPSQGDAEADAREHLDQIVMRAATQARMEGGQLAGMVPADVLRYIEELQNPTIPWYQLLINFFLEKAKEDYSMSRPNKRYLPDFVMPSLHSESMGKIVFICDASGSISHEQFVRFYSEAAHVKELMNPVEFVIASFDTQVKSVHRFQKDEHLDCPQLSGGGGTSIGPVLDFLTKEEPDVAVVFTDGYFWDHRSCDEPEYSDLDDKLFWLIDQNPGFECPIGEIVHFKE